MPRQVPLEVTQGIIQSPEDERPAYAPEDLPVEQRAGVPYDVWEANRLNGEAAPVVEKPQNRQKVVSEFTKSSSVPDNFTAQQQALADAMGQQKLAAEKEAGRTVEQQRERQLKAAKVSSGSKESDKS